MSSLILASSVYEHIKKLTDSRQTTLGFLGHKFAVVDFDLGMHRTDRVVANGKVMERQDFKAREGFIEYGPEDVDLLLWTGKINHEYAKTEAVAVDWGAYALPGFGGDLSDIGFEGAVENGGGSREIKFTMGIENMPVLGDYRNFVGGF